MATGSRVDDTPAHKALREAIINCMAHARYGMMNNIVIERYPDRLVFRNPGTMLVSVEQYFKGGTSICRNSTLQKIFSFVGGNERAGSGADMIVKAWADNNWPKPQLIELYDPDMVELTLFVGKQDGRTRVGTEKKTTKKTTEKKI